MSGDALTYGFLVVLPVTIGVAIIGYGLYDIDVFISRALVYGSLAVFITSVYVGIAVGIGTLVGSGGKPNLALSILATAIVASGFSRCASGSREWRTVSCTENVRHRMRCRASSRDASRTHMQPTRCCPECLGCSRKGPAPSRRRCGCAERRTACGGDLPRGMGDQPAVATSDGACRCSATPPGRWRCATRADCSVRSA